MSKIESRLCCCIICHKETSQLGIVTHYNRSHGDSSKWENSIFAANSRHKSNVDLYNLTPNKCKYCNDNISYEYRNNKFCSRRCSGIFNNNERKLSGWKVSEESIEKTRQKLQIYSGEYSKIYFAHCKFCGTSFIPDTNGNSKLVCAHCQHLKYKNNEEKWSFNFNVFNYPDLFDLDAVNSVGWVSFGGKRGGKKNPKGLSRDHKVSVDESKRNNYDPYYITHPLNCEIMPHDENNSKNTKSSISYSNLKLLVNAYDNRGDN